MLLGIVFVKNGYCVEGDRTGTQYDGTEVLIEFLKSKGVVSEEEADGFIRRHRDQLQKSAKNKKTILIIPEEQEKEFIQKVTKDVTDKLTNDLQNVRKDMDYMSDELMTRSRLQERNMERLEKQVTEDVADKLYKSSWAQRIRFGGDIRLRYQTDYLDNKNADLLDPARPNELMNTKEDRKRYRYRVRVSAKAVIVDPREVNVGKVEAGIRLSTGNQNDPISTNDTLGDYQNKDSLVLDQAYLTWKFSPDLPIWDNIPELLLIGGRMPNPWFFSDLVWDNDLNFEGFALKFRSDKVEDKRIKTFFTIGAFPLQEEEWSDRDKWLYGVQLGIQHKPLYNLGYTMGVAYYDYRNIEGLANNPRNPNYFDFTAPRFQTKGNTLFDIDPSAGIKTALASDYNLMSINGELELSTFFPINIIFSADYVKNLGFDTAQVARLTGNASPVEATEGYRYGLKVGYSKTREFGDWNTFFYYKHVEADAVLDAFTDSDFHLGGTNAKGWSMGAGFGLYHNLWLTLQWISSHEITGPSLSVDSLFMNINVEY